MIFSAFGLGEVNKKKMAKQNVDPAIADTKNPNYDITKHGEAVFTAYCQRCHGTGGTNGPGGLVLTVTTTDRATKLDRVINGTNLMAGFKDVLNPQEIEAVVTYVETLKK